MDNVVRAPMIRVVFLAEFGSSTPAANRRPAGLSAAMEPLRPHGRFGLLIVSSGERSRRSLEKAADESDLFWSIRSMADGRFALEHVWTCLEGSRKDVPDIVITDVQVAGLNGIQLTRELRRYEEVSAIYVAVLASNPNPMEQDAAETAGCDYFIPRPDTPDGVAAALKSIAYRCQAKCSVPARMLC